MTHAPFAFRNTQFIPQLAEMEQVVNLSSGPTKTKRGVPIFWDTRTRILDSRIPLCAGCRAVSAEKVRESGEAILLSAQSSMRKRVFPYFLN